MGRTQPCSYLGCLGLDPGGSLTGGIPAAPVPGMGGGSPVSLESIFAVCQQVSTGISPAPLLALPVLPLPS